MADLLLLVLDRLLEGLSIRGGERTRHIVEDRRRDRLRHVAEILRVHREEQFHQRLLRSGFDEPLAYHARDLDERTACLLGARLFPHQATVVGRKRLEDERQVRAVHRAHAFAQLSEILSMLQALEKIAFRPFLPMGQRFQHAVLVEQTCDLVEALLKTRFGANGHAEW